MSRCFEAYNGKPLERTRRTGILSAIRVCELGPEDCKVRDVFLDLMRDRLTDFFIRLEERRSDRLLDDLRCPSGRYVQRTSAEDVSSTFIIQRII